MARDRQQPGGQGARPRRWRIDPALGQPPPAPAPTPFTEARSGAGAGKSSCPATHRNTAAVTGRGRIGRTQIDAPGRVSARPGTGRRSGVRRRRRLNAAFLAPARSIVQVPAVVGAWLATCTQLPDFSIGRAGDGQRVVCASFSAVRNADTVELHLKASLNSEKRPRKHRGAPRV